MNDTGKIEQPLAEIFGFPINNETDRQLYEAKIGLLTSLSEINNTELAILA